MLLKNVILVAVGASGGLMIAGGIFAFITMIGIIPRFASKTETSKHVKLYEDFVVLGGTLGNIVYLYKFPLPLGVIGLLAFGVFSGIFVGCMAIALTEIIDTIPVFTTRIKLTMGAPYVLLGLALGKGVGSLLQFYFK